jgi:hypothetical protein
VTVGATLEVKGVKEALATLNALDKATRRQITRDFAALAKPMVDDAKRLLPGDAPMTGWTRAYNVGGAERAAGRAAARYANPNRGRIREFGYYGNEEATALLPWNNNAELRSIKAFTSGSRKKAAVFGMRWNSRTATLFDMAGKSTTPQGAQMINVLSSRYGSASRVMWKAYEMASADVQQKMRELVEKIMNESSYALRYKQGKTIVAKIVKVV